MSGQEVTPVAVIGMACRLPGGIDSPEALWEALAGGADLVTEVPADRWDADDLYDPEPGLPGRSIGKWGAFLDDVAGFDHEFFGINEREAQSLDPQHRLLLETSWEALDHAGVTSSAVAGTPTGVYVGLTHVDYQLLGSQSPDMSGPYGFQGNAMGMASGRIAHALGAHGPAITVDTACSSSLLAVHMACRSLHDGESDLALAGGAYVMLEPRKFAAASAQNMLSPTGRCRAFDAAADGFVSGEAAAMVLLKRLPDALRDGDRVLAVVRGTAANQDGRTVHIGTPSAPAQHAVYRRALAVAGVEPGTVGMVEAHGPGTPIGDPVEYASLAEVYGVEVPCALASAKTNFGHTQSAAGVLGLMKTVLSLEHGVVPPNLHFTRLPDELAAIDTKLFVPQALSPWTTNGGQPRRAAVSAYGLSGTNVHGVLEQAPGDAATAPSDRAGDGAPLLFALSATSPQELRRTAARLADWVGAHDDVALPDLAYTLARRRTHRSVRTTVVARDRTQLTAALDEAAAGDTATYEAVPGHDDRGPVWVFSGQGSQWAGMGAELLANDAVFASTVAEAEPVILRECGFSVREALSAPDAVTGQDRIQPTLFTMQVALAATLRAHGVRPAAVIGHSVGEAAAAVVAGALSLQDGLRVVCRRAMLMSRIAGAGATASVHLPAQQVLSELAVRGRNDVVVAVVPAPEQTVIAGAAETVRELVAAWEERGVAAREVPTDVAFHSPQVDPIVAELTAALADLAPRTPTIPFYSATSYDPRDEPVCDARYWASNMRRMVRFAAAVRAALEDGHRVFAELAPHPVLTHAITQTANSLDTPVAALATLRRGQRLGGGVLDVVGDMHCAGAAVDFSVLYPRGRLVDAPLPTWTHRRLWLGDDASTDRRAGHTVAVHPLLGAHVRVPAEPEQHLWEAELGLATHPWLDDHHVHDVPVFPGAGYCEMALAAAGTLFGAAAEVAELHFEQALLLDDRGTVGAAATHDAPGVFAFAVTSPQQGEQVRHAAAVLRAAEDTPPQARDVTALLAAHPVRRDGSEVRERLGDNGLRYGPAFSALVAVHAGRDGTDTVVAELAPNGTVRAELSGYGVHPAVLDACFQAIAAHPAVVVAAGDAMALPTGIRRLRAYDSARNARYCRARVTGIDATGIDADLEVLDQRGAVLIDVRGLRLTTGDQRDRVLDERLLGVEWRECPLPDRPEIDPGTWLLVGSPDDDTVAAELSRALTDQGGRCVTAARARDHLLGDLTGVVVVLPAPDGDTPGEETARVGRQVVTDLVHVAREVAASAGDAPRLYVVTRGAQAVLDGERPNLAQAGVRGLLRVVGNEHPELGVTHVDVDDAAGVGALVAAQLLVGSEEDECAWRDGRWYTARLARLPLGPEDRHTAAVDGDQHGVRLRVRTPGDLGTLEVVSHQRVSPGPGQIEVAVHASSVNFADVLVAFGRYPAFEGQLPQLGADFAGVVTAIGPGVTDHAVGDRVGGLCADGCWGTYLTCAAGLAVPIPAGLSDADAAAMTTAHATAYYGLHDLAHLTSDDRVLIHSATGGVGQAAIAIARAAGAEIFATAGSESRRQSLRDMGIDHVYDSRTLDFATQIRDDTQGYGVDVVLNSVTGPAQRASLELLTFGGRFVEIGKRDIYGDTRLGLFPFRRNLTFHAVDLGLLAHSHPDRFRRLLATVYQLVADGALPAPPTTHYPLADAVTAIRAMSNAEHTGKLVLDVTATGATRAVVPPAQVRPFRGDGAYVVTGGLGGLGLYLAGRMADAGAGRLVLSSRTPPSDEALATIEAIRATGADVVVECGDVTHPDTARRLVGAATATGLPVRGVLHAAAVIEDAVLANLTDDVVERDWAPKAYGAWHLHAATAAEPLDWFCAFSSAAALVGAPGQGAYAAANGWLDAFTRWRRTEGLPATAIAWGAWADVGRGTALAAGAEAAIAPDEGFRAFETLLRHDRAYWAYTPVTGSPWLTAFAQRTPFAEALRERRRSTGASQLRSELDALPRDEWPLRLRRMLSEHVNVIVRRSIDPDRPLPECGIDSLGALELCTRVEAETGVRVRATQITTIRELADLLCEKLAPAEASPTPSA
ncbi:polyketide synthase [Mycolicibacterium madagascariense]|uniref:Polyketide synthase n=1 Tax=Mycolicibacterium madagascariense TaxID=212765 RepID=A0A7I7XG34_9MYCO|nr:sulfolipid-1 biosynthesis phthioceranic/hydroxyphthioceranic acid synthase [Mycolicibacterium madagascariense]BBZ28131.1 polyketide synthase [Mycolicibacterium madagascariense]